ncbi:YdcF family protein [Pseudooctadecabacter jejudonensis]|uniref:DUF218 domain-containing protein n=1 Tax=Pseudooctadecabacter jejudonensis TaxID=1391910 RepID=A0A1Y5RFU6_9RHOB|nr:YdcF family protein [Pseudooctadecabacter jejudonensis]SLN15628.1 hypothetical protein PSJ8397_00351 [Pseudooctadecabacter jejudonensis]
MIRLLSRVIRYGLRAYLLMSAALLAWTFLWPDPDPDAVQPADAIVCLGGGMSPDGTLAQAVLTRIERCVQLHEAGIAPFVVFTGGTAAENGPDAGTQMARFAATLGLPTDAAVVEGRAQSTLQNALFTFDMIPAPRRIVLVTEAFHLPRSYASYKWAAWEVGLPSPSISLVMSEPVRRDPVSGTPNWRILARESLAIWFNLGRAVAYSVAPDPDVNWLH